MATPSALANRIAQDLRLLRPQTIAGRAVLSAAVHGCALLLITNWWWITAHRRHPAGVATGTRMVLQYKPGKTVESSLRAHRSVRRQHAAVQGTVHRPLAAPELTPALAVLKATSETAEPGDDAHGDGSASLRYVQAFPEQRPDFSGLGATGDVVVDLQIDDTGRVQRVFARKGMGSVIDAMVIATVQRWMFDPARKNGRPVASVQELHFHYDRNWSKDGCGWECIGLMSQ